MTDRAFPPQGSGARPARTTAEETRVSSPARAIAAQFDQLDILLSHLGRAEGVALALARLRVGCIEQAAALEELLAQDALSWAQTQDLRDLLEHLPIPVLRIDANLGVRFANAAAQELLGEVHDLAAPATLRRALGWSQIARLMRLLETCPEVGGAPVAAPPEGGPAATISAAPLVLHFAMGTGRRPAARASALRLRKPHPEAAAQYWLILVPEGSEAARSGDLLRHMLDRGTEAISVTDTAGRLIEANHAFLGEIGKPAEAVLGQTRQAFAPPLEALHHDQLDAKVRSTQVGLCFEETHHKPVGADGARPLLDQWQRLHTEKAPLFDVNGQVVGVVTRSHDVTEELRGRELAEMVFDHATDAIVLTDADLRVLRVNAAFEQMGGFAFAQLIGRPLHSLIAEPGWAEHGIGGHGGAQGGALAARLQERLRERGLWRGELVLRSAVGKVFTCWSRITRLTDTQGLVLGHVAMFSDLTLLRQAQAENLRLANYDLLTGLPNRQLLAERIEARIHMAERGGPGFALLFVDLDQFKSVNDSLGHETGDLLLNSVAQRLRGALEEPDFVARIGGDEFVILLDGADEASAQRRARDMLERLGRPLDLPGLHQYRPAASVGVACYGAHGDSGDMLLRNADLAMYAAKLSRRAVRVYEAQMGAEALRELELRNALVGAVERGEMVLHFQPLFRLGSREVCGCEALLRWDRPGQGLLRPGAFLPVAERAGLMQKLDAWVLERGVSVLGEWRARGLVAPDWRLSVNQTAADLAGPGWVETLAQALAQAGPGAGPLTGLQVELTEEQLASGVPGAIETIERLGSMGVTLAIDDFGTGYSSLNYLARLPVSLLKIAADFTRGICEDANARLIVEAITGLARQFGCATLAEGIETEAEAAAMIGLGCEMGQGYWVAHPLPQAEFEARFLGVPAFVA